MKIVITGALGHIGSRMIRDLPSAFRGASMVLVDNLSTQRYASLFGLPPEADYRFMEEDVLTADLEPVVKGASFVLHLAAITDAAGSFTNREAVENVNFNATRQVAQACRDQGVPLIHLSSTSVYGSQKECVDEECDKEDLRPQSPYAETKLKEENYLKKLAGLRFVICRFGTICGISPGMRFHTAVNKFCWQAVMGQPLTVWRTAIHQKRPYLTLDDAVNAIRFIAEKGLFHGQIYNIVTENMTVHSIIGMIKEYMSELSIQYVDTEIMNQLSYDVSNVRFRNEGFEFTGNIRKCIEETIQLIEKAGGRSVR